MPTVLLSGTQTAVLATEHYLVSENATNGTFVLLVDTGLMDLNDRVEFRILTRSQFTKPSRTAYLAAYANQQASPMKYSVPVPSAYAVTVTLLQSSTTGRNFDWSLMKV